jgi:hypothetical protein
VHRLSRGSAPENAGDCTREQTEGELSWNMGGQHSREFVAVEQELGGLDPVSQAAGRVFCTASSDVMRLVWTQDPGLLITATGQPASMVVAWWDDLHLELACASSSRGCD